MRKLFSLVSLSCVPLLTCISVNPALASSPTTAAEFAVTTAQSLLAAAPLPNLQGGDQTIAAQIGLVNGSYELDLQTESGEAYKVSGHSTGLNYSRPSKGDWGFFSSLIASENSGETKAAQNGAETYRMENMQAQVFGALAGITYRIVGDTKSKFALGYFAGPSIVSVQSSSVFVPMSEISSNSSTYVFDPVMYGLIQGFQFNLWLGKFLINPYVLLNVDLSESCKSLTLKSGPSTSEMTCHNGNQGADIMSSFPAGGLFLGYDKFRINVYSKPLVAHPTMQVTTYNFSYAFSW